MSFTIEQAISLYNSLYDYEKVNEELVKLGADASLADNLVIELKKIHRAKRRHRGIVLAGIGSFILIFGFILSIILFHAGMSIDIALFGPTSVGAIILIWGMAEIF